MLKLADKLSLSTVTRDQLTPEGYLDVRAKISRAGVYEYRAYELHPLFEDRDPLAVVNVFRSEDEVFKPSSMATFKKKPVTDGHPWEPVTASNVKDHQVGLSGEQVTRDGDFLSCGLLIQSADAVNRVLRGDGELSAGYECEVTRQAGEYQGVKYDAVQSNIIGNHIALVDAGRCGALCRVGDRMPIGLQDRKAPVTDCSCSKETTTMNAVTPPALQAIIHDGFTGQMDSVGATMFAKLRDSEAALKASVSKLEGELAATKATLADTTAKKDAEITTLKDSVPTGAKLDALVSARTGLITDAKKIMGDSFDASGKTDADIRRAVVTAKLGDAAVKDKDDGFVGACFATLVIQGVTGGNDGGTQHTQDSITQAVHTPGGGGSQKTLTRDQAREQHMRQISGAWDGQTKQ